MSHAEFPKNNVHVVPAESKLKWLVTNRKPMFVDLPVPGDQVDYFVENCGSRQIEHG
jgi:hypothetical protein